MPPNHQYLFISDMEKLKYRIDVVGYPYQRPRLGKYGNVHNPQQYEAHKAAVAEEVRKLAIPNAPYEYLRLHFFFPYAESEPKKNRLDLAPRRGKYDVDNLVKSFMDALQMSGVINNDSCICGIYAEKVFTVEKKGWIEFELE
jgi:Holliday junction resolvase RusA-like endonuclease